MPNDERKRNYKLLWAHDYLNGEASPLKQNEEPHAKHVRLVIEDIHGENCQSRVGNARNGCNNGENILPEITNVEKYSLGHEHINTKSILLSTTNTYHVNTNQYQRPMSSAPRGTGFWKMYMSLYASVLTSIQLATNAAVAAIGSEQANNATIQREKEWNKISLNK